MTSVGAFAENTCPPEDCAVAKNFAWSRRRGQLRVARLRAWSAGAREGGIGVGRCRARTRANGVPSCAR